MIPQKTLLSPGDEFQLGTVIAVHHQENSGSASTVLTFSMEDRYTVWTVDPYLKVLDRKQEGYGPDAYRCYVEKVAKQLFTYHNQPAPGLSFEVENKG